MKKIVAIFALLGILLQGFSQALIVAQYYANKDYIAKNLCENRDKPMLHCEGQCCLKRKLIQSEKSQSPTHQLKIKSTLILFFEEVAFSIGHDALGYAGGLFSPFGNCTLSCFSSILFRPPITCSVFYS